MDSKDIDTWLPMNGTIQRLVSDKGFGFILADDGNEYFFHNSGSCQGTRFDELREGQAVTFEKGQVPRVPAARTFASPNCSHSVAGERR